MVRVESTPILIDYALLRRDFPQQLSGASDEQIRRWIVDNGSYFRASQLHVNGKHCREDSCIHGQPSARLDVPLRKGYTSPMTQRSALVLVSPEHLLDLKGSGTDQPQPLDMHVNGILSLITAIHEFTMSKIVRRIGQVHERPFDAVDCYAVLHVPAYYHLRNHRSLIKGNNTLPHEFVNSPGTRDDLAILVRQASHRPQSSGNYLASLPLQIRFESALRSFGITSLATLYDEIYARDTAPTHPRMHFFDAQWAGHPLAFIDFTQLRFVSQEEAAAVQHWPVRGLDAVFYDAETRQGCMQFLGGVLKKNESECRAYLETVPALWQLPAADARRGAEYILGPGDAQWYYIQRDDYSVWFEEPQRSEIYELTFQAGPVYALQEDPMIYQTIFNRLAAILEKWPEAKHTQSNMNSHSDDVRLGDVI